MSWVTRSKVLFGVLAGVVGALLAVVLLPAVANSPKQSPALAATDTSSRGVAVSGTGQVYGIPDTLHLSMGVTVNRADVTSALNAASAALDKVISSLKSHGVPAKDIQTSGLNVNPHYTGDVAQHVSGYDVDHEITVTLRDLKTAGSIVSAAVAAGGNDARVNGLSVALESNDNLISAARERAFNDAKTKADQLARLAGRTLGRVLSISEQVASNPTSPMAFGGNAASTDSKAISIQPGQQAVDVTISVVWDFA